MTPGSAKDSPDGAKFAVLVLVTKKRGANCKSKFGILRWKKQLVLNVRVIMF